jgi:translation initiation factor IF-3
VKFVDEKGDVLRDQREVHRINELIRAPKVQVIAHDGQNLGVMSREDALRASHEASLDLVLIADTGSFGVPVVKITDFGKLLYARKKKLADAKKKQKVIKIKEIKLRPKIDEHDYQTKLNQAVAFLQDGNRVKFTLVFRGREMAMKFERGQEMFVKIDATLAEKGLDSLDREQDAKLGQFWSRVYFVKPSKK